MSWVLIQQAVLVLKLAAMQVSRMLQEHHYAHACQCMSGVVLRNIGVVAVFMSGRLCRRVQQILLHDKADQVRTQTLMTPKTLR